MMITLVLAVLTQQVASDTMFLTGGSTGDYIHYGISEVLSYDLSTPSAEWEAYTPMRYARSGHSCAINGNLMFVMGGHNYRDALDQVEVANCTDAKLWGSMPAMSTTRFSFASVVVEKKIYVIGGTDGADAGHTSKILNSTEFLDTEFGGYLWQPFAPLTTPRTLLSAVVVGSRIYVLGGVDAATGHASTTMEMIDTAAESPEWTVVSSGVPGSVIGAGAQGDKIYAILNDTSVHVLSTSDENAVWEVLFRPQDGTCVIGSSTLMIGSKLYLISGYDCSTGFPFSPLSTVNVMDTSKGSSWVLHSKLPTPRPEAAAAVYMI